MCIVLECLLVGSTFVALIMSKGERNQALHEVTWQWFLLYETFSLWP